MNGPRGRDSVRERRDVAAPTRPALPFDNAAHSVGGRVGRIAGFDGLRALSVLMVFAAHKIANGLPLERDVIEWLPLGSLGVKFFFVLSGFLIVGILHRQRMVVEAGGRMKDELGKFWFRRSLRILPIYFLTLAVITALALTSQGHALWEDGLAWYWVFLENFYLYVQALRTGSLQWGHFSHLWSVAVEQQFYAIAGFALLMMPRRHHARLLWATVAMAAASVVVSAATESGRSLYVLPLPNFAFMATGGLLAIGAWRGASTLRPAAIALVLLFAMPFLRSRLMINDAVMTSAVFALEFIAAVNLISYVSSNQQSRLVRFLEFAPLRGLGVISYGFYLYHYFVPTLFDVMRWFDFGPPTLAQKVLWTPVQLLLTVFASVVSWKVIEQPLLGLAHGRTRKDTVEASAPTVGATDSRQAPAARQVQPPT